MVAESFHEYLVEQAGLIAKFLESSLFECAATASASRALKRLRGTRALKDLQGAVAAVSDRMYGSGLERIGAPANALDRK